MSMLCFVCLLALPAQTLVEDSPMPPDPPEELLAAQAARGAFATAHVVWTMDEQTVGRRFFQSRFAGSAHLLVLHGDRHGALRPDRVGQPGAYSEVRQLLLNDAQWVYVQDTPSVSVRHGGDAIPMLDIRTVGFMPYYSSSQGLTDEFLSDPDIQDYEVLHDSGALLITARFTHGRAVRWWLDPKQGFQPTRCAMFLDEEFRGQTLTLYGEFDGVRFPQRLEYQDAEHEVTRSIDILLAAFNRPWHPASLGPADLGILPGHRVDSKDLGPSVAPVWDGAHVVTRDAFLARVGKGDLDAGAFASMVQQVKERGGPGIRPAHTAEFNLEALRRTPQTWEAYVQAFVRENDLDLDDIRKAWRLLEDARRRVHEYAESNAAGFSRLQQPRAAAAARGSDQSGSQSGEQSGGMQPAEQAGGSEPVEQSGGSQPAEQSGGSQPGEQAGKAVPADKPDDAKRRESQQAAEALERELLEPVGKIFDELVAALSSLKGG
ncbi:MAG: hypothetical protein C4547_14640 [Phycisphaerales bacterium]|nr:MAG: hypothetical protein C4547_14640 [Phycisphaerales bacterium]